MVAQTINSGNIGGQFIFKTSNYSGNVRSHLWINSNGRIGIETSAPDKMMEISDTTGNCLRLTYNDQNGSAANYSDLTVSSSGDLIITPSGGNVDFSDANIHSIDTAVIEEYLSAQEIAYTSSLQLMKSLRINPIYYNDFQYTNVANYYPWYGIAVSSGTITGISAVIDHPNIVRLASYSSGSNTGYQIRTNTTGIILTGGEVFEMIFKIATTTNSLVRLGFHNTQNNLESVYTCPDKPVRRMTINAIGD